MSDQILLAILASNRSFPTYIGFAEGHRTVLEAIRTREQERAEAAIELHILTGLEQLKSTIKTASDLPQTISEEHQTET
jgi:DNA-binding GntR family transcriptional regulator